MPPARRLFMPTAIRGVAAVRVETAPVKAAVAAEEEKAEATSVGLVGIVLPDNTVMPAPDNVTTMALALAA